MPIQSTQAIKIPEAEKDNLAITLVVAPKFLPKEVSASASLRLQRYRILDTDEIVKIGDEIIINFSDLFGESKLDPFLDKAMTTVYEAIQVFITNKKL